MELTLVYLPTCQTCNAAELLPALKELGITAEAIVLRSESKSNSIGQGNEDSGSVRTFFVDPQGGLFLALFFAAVYSHSELVACIGGGLDPTPEVLGQMLEEAEKGSDVVIASRYHRRSQVSYPWRRLLVSRGYSLLASLLLSLGTSDGRSGLKLYHRETLARALRVSAPRRVAFDVELLAYARRIGCTVAEVPVQVVYGDSPYALSLADMRQGLMDTLRLFYNVRVRRNPGRGR